MAPRKRHRPNPNDVTAKLPPTTQSQDSLPRPAHASASEDASHCSRPMPQQLPENSHGQESASHLLHHKTVRKAQSWYGSWPRPPKASASLSVARENIHGDTFRSKAADLTRFESKSVDDTASIRSKLSESAAASDQAKSMAQSDSKPSQNEPTNGNPTIANDTIPEHSKPDDNTTAPESNSTITTVTEAVTTNNSEDIPPAPTQPQSGWLGWLTRTSATVVETIPEESPEPPRPSTPPAQIIVAAPTAQSEPRQPTTSWFGLWTTTTPQAMAADSEKKPADDAQKSDTDVVKKDAAAPAAAPASAPVPALAEQTQEPPPKAGSTWAFWSKATPNQKERPSAQEAGEIAVIGEGSEAHPQPATQNSVSSEPGTEKGKAKDSKSTWRKSKRPRPGSVDEASSASPAGSQLHLPEAGGGKSDRSDAESRKSVAKPELSKSTAESETTAKHPPNLVLPTFASTYRMKENPSILQQITNLLLRTSQPPANHVFRVQETPKIKRALAIGVHGLFPATYLRPMMGQPTGTSLRFASLCADGIQRWADAHGCGDCAIEKVALEGEGRIGDRVENLWKLLLNWIDQIRQADLIVVACHSQGVPVGVMLLDKLIDLGIITDARIGVCAMAGVALGPFPDYKTSFLMGSAAELWDFGNPQSVNSQRFEAALKRVLDYGARVTLIGSIDDQVVPMESAVYSPASHPYIYRAVFIDGRIHAPDFIAHLIGFALKLRNLGVSDHGLVRELSLALAGSLYSGEGHSRLYYDDAVYDLAIAHALETTDVPKHTAPCRVEHRTAPTTTPTGAAPALASPNPYVLPWIMRGLLEEDFVKTELSAETEELLRQFDDWKPSNKALKDVKYRLEAVRSKL